MNYMSKEILKQGIGGIAMTCKDCVHYDVCNRIGNKILNGFEVCDQFKDKTRFLNIGDKIYQHDSGITKL